MYRRLPLTITRLVFLLLLTTPFLSLANPLPEASPATPAQLQPRAPQASKRMGQRRATKAEPLRKKDYSSFLCPGGAVACPIHLDDVTPASISTLQSGLNSLADWFKVGFECIELATELNSCGGCLAFGAGYVYYTTMKTIPLTLLCHSDKIARPSPIHVRPVAKPDHALYTRVSTATWYLPTAKHV